MLVSAYALSVAFGSPLVAACLLGLERRLALIVLMGLFVLGSVACAFAPTYGLVLSARVGTALAHGAFFGIGAVVVAQMAPVGESTRAVATLFTGLTLANVIGVPLGTWLGQISGWRSTFLVVAGIGLLSIITIFVYLPRVGSTDAKGLRHELAALRTKQVWLAMLMSTISSAALFSVLTYLTPLLEHVSGMAPSGAAFALFLFGAGLTIGGLAGGRLADWRSLIAIRLLLIADVGALLIFVKTSQDVWLAMLTVFVWGAIAFALVPPLQTRVVQQAPRRSTSCFDAQPVGIQSRRRRRRLHGRSAPFTNRQLLGVGMVGRPHCRHCFAAGFAKGTALTSFRLPA